MESIWSQTCAIPQRDALPGDIQTEVAVIGAGMAGILIASALQEAGKQVIVLEAERVASGQTRNTTAKITCQHGLIYEKLIRTLGPEKARQYAQAAAAALEEYRRVISSRGISCDLERKNAYVYGMDAAQLRREAAAAASLGFPATFVEETKLPFPTAGAVRFADQAQFHPLKFLQAIAEPLTIYEHTSVKHVEGNQLITAHGRVQAEQVVFACHYPFVNFPGMYFARMHQQRSYVIALENAAPVDGMWIGAGAGGYSFRNYGSLLLLGGGGHRCGENSAGSRYALLRQQAARWYPGSREVARWSAQDCVTPDSVPYIGPYAASRPNWFVATGFQKWGMTSSMVAAMLLRDRLCGRETPYAEVFTPRRFTGKTLSGAAREGAQAIKGLSRQVFQLPTRPAGALEPGHGGIVFQKGKKLGVYKDEGGALHPVNTRCPHMGCQLEWNGDERSWDCPCHGSRFDHQGKLISGPAQENLKP